MQEDQAEWRVVDLPALQHKVRGWGRPEPAEARSELQDPDVAISRAVDHALVDFESDAKRNTGGLDGSTLVVY